MDSSVPLMHHDPIGLDDWGKAGTGDGGEGGKGGKPGSFLDVSAQTKCKRIANRTPCAKQNMMSVKHIRSK